MTVFSHLPCEQEQPPESSLRGTVRLKSLAFTQTRQSKGPHPNPCTQIRHQPRASNTSSDQCETNPTAPHSLPSRHRMHLHTTDGPGKPTVSCIQASISNIEHWLGGRAPAHHAGCPKNYTYIIHCFASRQIALHPRFVVAPVDNAPPSCTQMPLTLRHPTSPLAPVVLLPPIVCFTP